MRRPFAYKFFLAPFMLTVCLATNSAAQDRSHILIPNSIKEREDASNLLLARLGRAKDFSRIRQLAQNVLKNNRKLDLGKLQETITNLKRDRAQFDPKDPKWRKLLGDIVNDPAIRRQIEKQKVGTPEQLQALDKLADDLKLRKRTPMTPPDVGPVQPPPSDNRPPTPPTPENPKTPPSPPATPTPSPNTPQNTESKPQSEESSQNWFQQRLKDVQGWAKDQGNNLGNSMQDWLKNSGIDLSGVTNDITRQIKGLLPDLNGMEISGLRDKLMGWLPKENGLGNINLTPDNLPSIGTPGVSTTGFGGIGQILLIGLFIGGGLILIAVLLASSKALLEHRNKKEWQLGPWPVRPENVHTQEDLIKAFEYLALLRLGRDASTFNHIDIATELANRFGGMLKPQQAVEHLVHLYEQARYAPATEPLSSDELMKVRQELSLLAGVAA